MNFTKRLISAPHSTVDDIKKSYQQSNHLQNLPEIAICQRHNERKVALDQLTNQQICNKCLFENQKIKLENSQNQNPLFTPLITKDIKKRYDQQLAIYKDNLQKVQFIQEDYVKQKLTSEVQNYFKELKHQLTLIQTQLNNKIQSSESLKQLEDLMEKNKDLFSEKAGSQFYQIKSQFDGKIERSRFSSIITHKEFYKSILEKVDLSIVDMNQTFDQIKQLCGQVLVLQHNYDQVISENFDMLIDESFAVDQPLYEDEVNIQEVILDASQMIN
ncbi:UNKNOWN [Stylonychia lemnae]|uniref:Uncharacterized protein n=1 Tax=Stylonychia lemnae TaxID=5949 RepID=A0A077ZYI6_STYLE|nr:UNKNOWN [Stylonychia lemnae]|eukprot:CDW74940.1 UNKNOWN [Stylonychia lemnae]